MALTISQAGSGNSTTSSSTLAVTLTQSFAVGDMVVVCIASDNNGTDGVDSVSSVTDSKSHTYTLRAERNNDPGAAAAGASINIYTAIVTTAMTTSDVVTTNFSPNTTSKAVVIWEVAPGAGETPTFVSNGSTTGDRDPALTSSSINSGNAVIYAIAAESRATLTGDSDTTRGSWSSLYTTAADTGTNSTSMRVGSQHKVVNATGTQAWSGTINDCDFALAYIILNPAGAAQTVSRTATGSGAGTQTATGSIAGAVVSRAATGSGVGSQNATRTVSKLRTAATRYNLIANPSFETNLNGWAGGNSTLAQTAAWSASGSFGLSVTPNSTNPDSYADFAATASVLGIQGKTVTLSATINTPIAQTGTLDGLEARTIQIFWQRASTGATFYNQKSTQATTTGVQRVSVTASLEADATNVIIRLNNGATNTATNVVYFDAVLLETSSSLLPYIDISGGAYGTETATGVKTKLRTATGSGVGTQTAAGVKTKLRVARGIGFSAISAQPSVLNSALTTVNVTTFWIAQTFAGNGSVLDSIKLNMNENGSVGDTVAVVDIYALTGTLGAGTPTGSVLATSGNVTIPTSAVGQPTFFPFSGANKIVLSNGVNYAFVVRYVSGTNGYQIRFNIDTDLTAGAYVSSSNSGGSWTSLGAARELIYGVYGVDATGVKTKLRTATGSGVGTQTAVGAKFIVTIYNRTATGSGAGGSSVLSGVLKELSLYSFSESIKSGYDFYGYNPIPTNSGYWGVLTRIS